jgi:hypothetical protein
MRLRILYGSAGTLGAGLSFAVLLALAAPALGGDFPPGFNPENFEIRTYAPNSTREIADCKVAKIFLDHRKLGFFKVKLLPLLVVQGVRVEFGDANSTNEWMGTFQSGWLPKVDRRGVEWRDVGVSSQKPGAPSLHADLALPSSSETPIVCVFKDVTLEANGSKWRVSQAELRNEDGRPRLVWKDGGVERRMDLFSGEIYGNSN